MSNLFIDLARRSLGSPEHSPRPPLDPVFPPAAGQGPPRAAPPGRLTPSPASPGAATGPGRDEKSREPSSHDRLASSEPRDEPVGSEEGAAREPGDAREGPGPTPDSTSPPSGTDGSSRRSRGPSERAEELGPRSGDRSGGSAAHGRGERDADSPDAIRQRDGETDERPPAPEPRQQAPGEVRPRELGAAEEDGGSSPGPTPHGPAAESQPHDETPGPEPRPPSEPHPDRPRPRAGKADRPGSGEARTDAARPEAERRRDEHSSRDTPPPASRPDDDRATRSEDVRIPPQPEGERSASRPEGDEGARTEGPPSVRPAPSRGPELPRPGERGEEHRPPSVDIHIGTVEVEAEDRARESHPRADGQEATDPPAPTGFDEYADLRRYRE